MKKILRYAGKGIHISMTIFLGTLLVCNMYLIFMGRVMGVEHPTIFGYSIAVVVSGSMEPSLSVDDLLVNRLQSHYKEGDIITFQSGNSLTTHRIVRISDKGYVTQGDANNAPDQEIISPEAVVGQVVQVIPKVGRILAFLKTPLGMILLVLSGFLLIELPYFVSGYEEKTH